MKHFGIVGSIIAIIIEILLHPPLAYAQEAEASFSKPAAVEVQEETLEQKSEFYIIQPGFFTDKYINVATQEVLNEKEMNNILRNNEYSAPFMKKAQTQEIAGWAFLGLGVASLGTFFIDNDIAHYAGLGACAACVFTSCIFVDLSLNNKYKAFNALNVSLMGFPLSFN